MCGGLRKRTAEESGAIMEHKKKLKKCKVCQAEFSPRSSLDKVCGVTCAIKYAKDKEATKQKQTDRIRKELLKSRGDWIREAQAAFNKFVRLRDAKELCISCDKPPYFDRRYLVTIGGDWDCGHYRSVGSAPELRFCELNAHKQCKKCNQFLSGNVVDYRKRLLDRIGSELVDWVEGQHEPAKLSIQDIKDIKKKYSALSRELEKAQLEQT